MVNSPLWQPEGERIAATRAGDQELLRVTSPASARWHATGLDGDGQITRPTAIALAPGYRATLVLGPPSFGVPSRLAIRLGDERREVGLPAPGSLARVKLSTCDATGPTRGTIRPAQTGDAGDGRQSGGVLVEAQLAPCSG
jgi:hypothetical protein